jgi:uncharacterized protein YkwD
VRCTARAARAVCVAVTAVAVLSPASAATPVDLARQVRLQGCHGLSGTDSPLQPVDALRDAARNAAHGMPLKAAIARSGYRDDQSALLHVSGEPAALQQALAAQLCRTLIDPRFTEVGVAQSGRDTWMVFAAPFSPPMNDDAPHVASDLLAAINVARSQARRCGDRWFAAAAPLQSVPQLREAAERHARDMLEHDYFAHEGHDGSSPAQRVGDTGYRYRIVGENIASGPQSVQEAVDGWIASPGHCENLMDARFTDSGVAYAVSSRGPPRIYWVQDFAARTTADPSNRRRPRR